MAAATKNGSLPKLLLKSQRVELMRLKQQLKEKQSGNKRELCENKNNVNFSKPAAMKVVTDVFGFFTSAEEEDQRFCLELLQQLEEENLTINDELEISFKLDSVMYTTLLTLKKHMDQKMRKGEKATATEKKEVSHR